MSNIDLIKQRLNKLQSKSTGNYEKIDYSTLFWKPKLGKSVVRIVPRKANRDFPFVEVPFHQYNVFKKSVYSLSNFGEKDPVEQLVKDLYNENTEEAKELARKIKPRTKYYAQVLVRGEEGLGIRLWEFNKTTYEKLLGIMADDDFGDVADIASGTDLTIEGYNDSIKIGKREVTYIAVNVTPKRNISPLAENADLVKSYLENQKDILEIYKKYTYDEIKAMLKTYLDPQEEAAAPVVAEAVVEDETSEPAAPFDGGTPIANYEPAIKAAAQQPVKSAADKFKDMFEDDED
jgi:hypothetical protein